MKVAGIFSDGAVLQCGVKVPVWGTAPPGTRIVVSYHQVTATTTTDARGHWSLRIGPFRGGLAGSLVVSGNGVIEYKDVVTGEVWLCAGQSNMQMPVRCAWNGVWESGTGLALDIRHYQVPIRVRTAPDPAVSGRWVASSEAGAADFSAVGYFFARTLAQRISWPIGIINASKGGAPIEAWLSPTGLKRAGPAGRRYPAPPARPTPRQRATGEPKSTGEPFDPIEKAMSPFGAEGYGNPGVMFNGMVAALVPYALRGVLWYQGEANTSRMFSPPDEYEAWFKRLISDWRREWGSGRLPFYFVQLPANAMPDRDWNGHMWAEIREAQRRTLSVAGTRMVVTIDLDDVDRIHPRSKQEIGFRLGATALTHVYRAGRFDSSPLFARATQSGDKLKVEFNQCRGGLRTRGTSDATGFEVRTANGTWFAAAGVARGQCVIFEIAGSKRITGVRYGWAQNPERANVCGRSGLPAAPFTTGLVARVASSRTAL